jgi:glycosyltransferase involved in cell wall biosynthesis
VVVGSGRDLGKLREIAGPTVEFTGRLPDAEVSALLSGCRAFLFPGEEDFGIAPIEAMASGRPVIAYGAGGALDTVIDGETGVLFDAQTVESLSAAILRLEEMDFDRGILRAHALRFDTAVFKREFAALVARCPRPTLSAA